MRDLLFLRQIVPNTNLARIGYRLEDTRRLVQHDL